jgi:threonine dehydrogenase-like Zn-dependent dehydrogenase
MARVFGARVIGADVSDDKLAAARRYGCEVTINVRGKDMAGEVLAATGGRGVDCAVDMVSTGQTMNGSIRALGRGGIEVLLTASAPLRVSCLVPGARLDEAVRLLHLALFSPESEEAS